VPVTTLAFDRIADAAVSARVGADLFRFDLHGRIPDTAFAANSDGTVTVTGVELLKSGTFNGLTLLDTDLDSMVTHFGNLRDAGIFLPPFRLDHSWSVLSVIGWFEELRVSRHVDPTDSLEKNFLEGDIRLTGSVDYTSAQIVKAIKSGSLRNRSSELGYYVTNSGVELPLVFYGCAFVDIPAVEGLAPVALSKVRLSTPHKITRLNADTEESEPMGPQTTEQTDDAQVETDPVTETPDEASETADGDASDPAETDASEEDAEVEGDESTEDAEVDDTPPLEADVEIPDPTLTEEPVGIEEQLTAARAEITRLRTEAATREIERFRSAGVIVQANEEAATALLTHDDPEVRRCAGTILGHVPAIVELGRKRGRTSLNAEGTPAGSDVRIEIGMSKDEVSDLWTSLTPAERKEGPHRDAYDAWRKHRTENNIRD
jgi:hypothetical protein